MLPKKNRVGKEHINLIFKKGRFINSPKLTLRFLMSDNKEKDGRKISFIIPKSIVKLAVKRNLLRRRGYSALRSFFDRFPLGLIGVFIFKEYEDNVSMLENEIKKILSKIYPHTN